MHVMVRITYFSSLTFSFFSVVICPFLSSHFLPVYHLAIFVFHTFLHSFCFTFFILSSFPLLFLFTLSFICPSSLIKAGNKPPPATPGKPKKATTFQEFESITSDAWDVGDDDDELLAMAAQNLNIEVVMETANKVNNKQYAFVFF